MLDYLTVKSIHVGSVALSGGFFAVRGIWMLRASSWLQARWVKVLPHVIDVALLASAVTLAVMSGQSPGRSPWVAAKVVALLAYVALGTIALKRGKTLRVRAIAFALALACFAYIVGVALTRSPALGLG